jgi:hypothetical protein
MLIVVFNTDGVRPDRSSDKILLIDDGMGGALWGNCSAATEWLIVSVRYLSSQTKVVTVCNADPEFPTKHARWWRKASAYHVFQIIPLADLAGVQGL